MVWFDPFNFYTHISGEGVSYRPKSLLFFYLFCFFFFFLHFLNSKIIFRESSDGNLEFDIPVVNEVNSWWYHLHAFESRSHRPTVVTYSKLCAFWHIQESKYCTFTKQHLKNMTTKVKSPSKKHNRIENVHKLPLVCKKFVWDLVTADRNKDTWWGRARDRFVYVSGNLVIGTAVHSLWKFLAMEAPHTCAVSWSIVAEALSFAISSGLMRSLARRSDQRLKQQ